MRAAEAGRHIRHIASLGLGAQIAVPEMLRSLGHIVPGLFNSFFWIDAAGRMIDAYSPYVVLQAFEAAAVISAQLKAGEPTLDRIIGVGLEVGSAQRLHAAQDFSRSGWVNDVWRPFGIGCGLDLILRDGGTPRAILFVNREPRSSRFSAQEFRALRSLAPHFLHALDATPGAQQSYDDTEESSALILLEPDGTVRSLDPGAVHLMLGLTGMPLQRALPALATVAQLSPALRLMLQRHQRLRAGEPEPPMRLEQRNGKGCFRLRVYPQYAGAQVGTAEAQPVGYAVALSHHLPRTVRLARQVAGLDLSPREREVAFRLAIGDGADEGADALGVSVSTWRSYVKRVYQRLDIASRGEFHTRIQGLAAPGAERDG